MINLLSMPFLRAATSLGLLAVSGLAMSAPLSMRVADEDAITANALKYTGTLIDVSLATPLLCGNTETPVATTIQFKPSFGTFLFGTYDAGGNLTQVYRGVASFKFQADSLLDTDGTLVCYALSTQGVRKATRGIFIDGFDLPTYDSTIKLSVAQLPTANNSYIYKYYIDVNIPKVGAISRFQLRDGFESAYFNPNAVNWCEAAAGATSCPGLTNSGHVMKDITLSAGQSYAKRFIVWRALKDGLTMVPNNHDHPAVLAALFSPDSIEEVRLDNNVSVGYGELSDLSPTIDTSGTSLVGLTEGGNLQGVSFSIVDDTSENVGLLGATVELDFHGVKVAAPTNCVANAPPPEMLAKRTCTFDITTPNADFATDGIVAGTFAPGVSASVKITAQDGHGQTTTTSLPLHVTSGDNDAPVFDFNAAVAPVDGETLLPTLTCSLSSPSEVACIGVLAAFVHDVAPAPPGAVDELGYQGSALNLAAVANGGNISCVLDQGSLQIFALNKSPKLSSSDGNHNYLLDYSLSANPGAATCSVTARDGSNYPGNTFPDAQTLKTTTKQFRIVVSP